MAGSPRRSKSPAPRAKTNGHSTDGVPKDKFDAATGVVRKQSRPIGEFGGNLGCLFWTIVIPIFIWYFYGLVVMKQGALAVPDWAFWNELIWELPEGIAIRPTWTGFLAFVVWIFFQALLEIFVPPFTISTGVKQKNGNAYKYPMNGLRAYFLSHLACYVLCYFDFMEPYFVWRQMGSLLTGAVILSHILTLWQYIDYGLLWRRHVNDPEFEEDWGVFTLGEFFSDYWLGVARNPRFLHKALEKFGGFDIKRFGNARGGLTIWVICNQSYLAAIYYACQVDSNNVAVCAEQGDWSRVSWSALMITFAHCYYIFDYNWNEPAYLTTTDIRHDLYGFMLIYGCLGFLPWYYSFSFVGHIAFQKEPLNDNFTYFAVGAAMYILGMWLFRVTNIQKHNFRTYISDGGDLANYMVWGKPVTYIRTEEGSYLLTAGYWGLARHFNYIGDMVMCIGWAVACAGPSHGFPWVPVSYCVYFWLMDVHRLTRDEARCAVKYKQDWERYKEAVPWFIVPGVF